MHSGAHSAWLQSRPEAGNSLYGRVPVARVLDLKGFAAM